jgi:hypothetical protein
MDFKIYSDKDKDLVRQDIRYFAYAFLCLFILRTLISVFQLCSLSIWLHLIMGLFIIYWSIKVYLKLTTSNKVLFCVMSIILLSIVYALYAYSYQCN